MNETNPIPNARHPIKAGVDNLILEVTRRCNMDCDHCLRGDAQQVDISDQTLEQILDPIEAISSLTFTGGEPSLCSDRLAKTLELCKAKEIPVDSVYIVTNGKTIPDAFLRVIQNWNEYTTDFQNRMAERFVQGQQALDVLKFYQEGRQIREYGCHVALSMDKYHEPIPIANIHKLSYSTNLNTDKYMDNDDYLIHEGRAMENGLGYETLFQRRSWLTEEYMSHLPIEDQDENHIRLEEVYFNALGELIPDSDMSYETQTEHRILRLNDLSAGQTWVDRVLELDQKHQESDE